MGARSGGQSVLSLVEIILVVVIIGLLSVMAVVGARDVKDKGQTVSCMAEEAVLTDAVQVAQASGRGLLNDTELRAAGFLAQRPRHHSVTVVDGNLVVAADALCAGLR
jgi:type II secretory pathway pseudopilin PulG